MNILPDSRLQGSIGNVMADWPDGNGGTTRLELQPIYCFNCGRPNGYVPVGIMSFVSWLCTPCAEKWGHDASLHTCPDQEFWDKVHEEMMARFGRALTERELSALAEHGKLGRGLELLDRESPYRSR